MIVGGSAKIAQEVETARIDGAQLSKFPDIYQLVVDTLCTHREACESRVSRENGACVCMCVST